MGVLKPAPAGHGGGCQEQSAQLHHQCFLKAPHFPEFKCRFWKRKSLPHSPKSFTDVFDDSFSSVKIAWDLKISMPSRVVLRMNMIKVKCLELVQNEKLCTQDLRDS